MPFSTSSVTSDSLSNQSHYLMWFRRDLRIHDNTALTLLFDNAHPTLNKGNNQSSTQISALYTLTSNQWLKHDMSLAQMDLIFRTLKQLAITLFNELNIVLQVINSDTFTNSIDVIEQLCIAKNITHVFANIEYEINEQARDKTLETKLAKHDIEFTQTHDQCILPPNTVKTNDDTLYKVFTPFYKKWQSILETSPVQVYPAPTSSDKLTNTQDKSDLDQLLSKIDDFYQQTLKQFQQYYGHKKSTVETLLEHAQQDYPAGETQARSRLDSFIEDDIGDYNTARDKPALMATSQLSAYLTVGAISARLCYQKANELLYTLSQNELGQEDEAQTSQTDIERWIGELAWRDFYRHVINNRPDIVKGNAYKKETDKKVNWSYDKKDFKAWCDGKTGVPLVDAAMRCLNQTGFMHNRLRMVTAMFLTKDLLIDWRLGERYFMQQLIDGDFASNNGGWQWSASTGVDASPYFRIMNPFSQAKTHDKDAIFIKTWLPELKNISAKVLHDEIKLRKALGADGAHSNTDYPLPIVNHKQARLQSIAEFKGETINS